VTHPPRKTRFRLLVRLYRTGLVTRRVPSERFQASAILLSRASWRDVGSIFRSNVLMRFRLSRWRLFQYPACRRNSVVPGLQAMDFGAQLKPSDDVAMDTAEGQV